MCLRKGCGGGGLKLKLCTYDYKMYFIAVAYPQLLLGYLQVSINFKLEKLDFGHVCCLAREILFYKNIYQWFGIIHMTFDKMVEFHVNIQRFFETLFHSKIMGLKPKFFKKGKQ